jgi:hypothetical protein
MPQLLPGWAPALRWILIVVCVGVLGGLVWLARQGE